MTNSTAKSKAKGPLRTGALVPSLIFLALIYAYFFFFFDSHLRRGMEYIATQVHGAEINIGGLNTSFWRASFALTDLQVTDKEQPERNLVQVGEIKFGMIWDALLRAKVGVNEASILNIQAFTKRKKPGYVLPPPPPSESYLAKVQDQVLQQTRQQFNKNFLGDIADVLSGVDPKEQLKNIEGELKASARAKELEKELTAKQAEWKKRVADLPKPQEVKALEQQIKALNFNTKNPAELAQNLKKAKEILGEAQAKVKQVDQTQSQLSSDVSTYTAAVGNLEKLAAQDVADLQKRLQIPSIDPKEFSTQLFMAQVEKRLVSIRKYIAVARKVMPPKKTAEEKAQEKAEQLVPRKRGQGRTYAFPITTGYPLFWLKHGAISSQISQSEWAGNVKGEIIDLTTSPSQLGRPTKINLAGDFPKQEIHGLTFNGIFDHTGERAKETIKAAVASFPVTNQVFSDSPSVKLGLKEAKAGGSLNATLIDETLNIAIQSKFDQPKFELEAKSKQVQEILSVVLAGIPLVTMDAAASGSWDKFSLSIDSNLGRELSNGFQKQLQAKLGDAKAKLHSFVDSKIGGDKKKAQDQLAGLTSGPGKLLAQNKDEMGKALKSAEGAAAGPSPADRGKGLLKKFGL